MFNDLCKLILYHLLRVCFIKLRLTIVCEVKYNNILDCFYEKERIILELKDKHNLKEDEFLRKIFKYEEEITNLNEKLDENEKKKHNVNSIKIIENL